VYKVYGIYCALKGGTGWAGGVWHHCGESKLQKRYTFVVQLLLDLKKRQAIQISLFHRAFQFTMCSGRTNALLMCDILVVYC
jgi:hypothetical protein